MTTRHHMTAAMLLFIASVNTQAQQKAAASPLLPPLGSTHRAIPKSTDPNAVEVKKPAAFSDQDWRVLHSIDTLSTDRLQQLLLVYERIDSDAMTDVVVRELLRRDPKNKEALRVRDGGQSEEVIRPANYLTEIAKKVMAGETVPDVDSVPVQATSLILEGRVNEAIALLEKLRANQYKGSTFPYLDDLAYAYSEAERFEEAEAAYRAVVSDVKMPAESIADAQQSLPHIVLKRRIANYQRDLGRDGQALLAMSAKLLAENPNDEDAEAFRVESLQATNHYAEAVSFLLAKKKQFNGEGPWPWKPDLAFCYFGARQFDKAIALFREIQKDSRYDDRSRDEAATMILEVQVTGKIEGGMYAMQHGDFAKAKSLLDELEANYGTHRDVLGYRATYLAKTGRSDEALKELLERKTEDTARGIVFTQQDALADVYLERKEFGKAREATLLIVNDARYDAQTRMEAVSQLEDITVAEAQEGVYVALHDGQRAKARALVEELRVKAPRRLEVRMLDAEIALAYYQPKYARDELLGIKNAPYPQGFAGMPFDAQNSLAAAQAMAGDWEAAYASFSEVVNAPAFNYEPEDIWEARWDRRELLPWFSPTFTFSATSVGEDEGDLFTTQQEYKTGWLGDWRYGVFARSITTNLKKNSIFYGRSRETQFEGGVTAMRRFNDNYFVEGMIGASQDDPIYGLRVGKLAYESIGWSLGFVGNALSTDSVNLQAINGRENRVEFKIGGPITDRLNFDLNAWYQWNRVGGARLGTGYGASGELDYVLQTETRHRPEISIGYAFDYARFDAAAALPPRISNEVRRAQAPAIETRKALGAHDEVRRALAGNFGNEVFDSLIDPYTNRHGIVLKARKHFENHLALSGSIGAYYSFDDVTVGFTASVAAEYWINERAMIYAELRYDTNGKGASSNGGVLEANVGGQVSF